MTIKTQTVYICDICESEYDSEKEMNNCIKNCKKSEKQQIENQKIKSEFRLNLDSIKNIKAYMNELSIKRDLGLTITTIYLSFSKLVCNSHASPMNGRTNFTRMEDLPKGYPGWTGYIRGTMSKPYNGFMSDIFQTNFPGINTGTGSGGETFEYEVKIFVEDFPKLKVHYEKYLILLPLQANFMEKLKKSTEQKIKDCDTFVANDEIVKKLIEEENELDRKLIELRNTRSKISLNLRKNFETENSKKYIIDREFDKKQFEDCCDNLYP